MIRVLPRKGGFAVTTLRLREAYRGGYRDKPGWWIAVDYSEEGIEALKAAIPAEHRTWDQEGQRWWISCEMEPYVLKVIPALEAFMRQKALL